MAHHLTTLPSGDEVGFSATGDPLAQRLVLLCLPTPGAGMFDPDPVVTNRWGVHVVALDRPGYGATPPGSGSGQGTGEGEGGRSRGSIQDRADDLAAWLRSSQGDARQSGATVFGAAGVVGWGTGGMVALALAARHPDLVDRVAAFQTAAPHGLSFDPSLQAVAPFGPEALGIPADDPLLERPGLRNRLDRMLEEAGLQGSAGVELDRQALADHSWARELGAIRAEVRLIYADDLSQVDRYDGHWYRRRIRSSKVVRVSSGGALAIATEWDRILSFVAPDHGGLSEQTRLG
ncbi:alpha/beta hydrolase [Herbiconiux sp.]|uniref:alpha/beta fold hydrolase n=1 Tax=Herbiconiux sp. TaxID=1871186 RepID=UPI0025C70833|nr:alpha/beta hydrolase [Herbiconiux sp.]